MLLPPDANDENANSSASATDSRTLLDTEPTLSYQASAPVDAVQREFEFPGMLASVPECCGQVMQFVIAHCPDEDDQIDILVALQEALANAALHGCRDDPTKQIQCTVVVDASDTIISIRDPGPGFDVALADPENNQATAASHGRGICLMRSLMTEVKFAQGGSEIRLRKRLCRDR